MRVAGGRFSKLIATAVVAMVALNPTLYALSRTREVMLGPVGGMLPSAAAAILLAATVAGGHVRQREMSRVAIIALTMLWVTGLLNAIVYGRGDMARALYYVVPAIVLPMTMITALGARRALRALLGGLLVTAAITCAGSLFLPGLLFNATRDSYTPLHTGWFANPNMYGGMAFIGFLALRVLARSRIRKPGIWGVALMISLAALFMTCIVVSTSRASAVGLLVFLLAETVTTAVRSKLGLGAKLLVSLALLTLLVGASQRIEIETDNPVVRGYLIKRDGADVSGGRMQLWGNLLEVWDREAPVAGMGVGTASETAERFGYSGAHNALLGVLIERGGLGLGLVLCVVVTTLVAMRRLDASSPSGYVAMALALLAHSMFEDHLFSLGITASGILFALMAVSSGRTPVPDAAGLANRWLPQSSGDEG